MSRPARERVANNRPIIYAFAAAIALFAITSAFSPGFASGSHIRVLLISATIIGLVALGQTFVIITGGIDLSAPWTISASGLLVTQLAHGSDAPLAWAIPLMLGLGAVVGLVNGLGITVLGVAPIIMTLAINGVVEGGILLHTGGSPPGSAPHLVTQLGSGSVGPVPIAVIVWAILAAVATVVLTWTPFGRHLYAVGTNRTVAEFSGIAVRRVTIAAYVISGMTAAAAGILLAGYSGQAYLGMGDPYLFSSVAAVAIGGASILGGSGHYLGTMAGALVLTVLAGLLPILNLNNAALQIIYGAVILATLSVASLAPRTARG